MDYKIYRFGKVGKIDDVYETAKIRIYINSSYNQKEEVKNLGGKFDFNGLKKWYFEYNTEDFKKNKKLYTFQFPPHSVNIIGDYNYKSSKSETEQLFLNECKNRWNRHFIKTYKTV